MHKACFAGLDPAEGAADARDHRGRAHVEAFVSFEGGGDVEEEFSGADGDFELFPGLFDLHFAGRAEFDGLGAVEADIGLTGGGGGERIAVVEAHPVADGLRDAAGVLDGDGASCGL